MEEQVLIAGGGLAGSEAAWQLASRGVRVTLCEMRPLRPTPAHKSDQLAELVCSNSLKSNAPGAASWLLKEEMRRAGSVTGDIPLYEIRAFIERRIAAIADAQAAAQEH